MRLLFLWILLLLGSSQLYAQSPTPTQEAQMRALGFEPVDLQAMRQQQAARPACATCPRAKNTVASTSALTPAEELAALRADLPRIERLTTDAQANPSMDAATKQKYQTALNHAKARIQVLEKQLASVAPQRQ